VLAIQPSSRSTAWRAPREAAARHRAPRLERPGRHARRRRAALASYLLFEPGFIQALVALGERDAFARKQELLAFVRDGAA
jgi:NTE family protein